MSNPWSIRNFDKIFEADKEIEIEANKLVKRQDEDIRNEIKSLYSKGWSYAKIADKLGTSRSAVSGIIFRAKANSRKNKD